MRKYAVIYRAVLMENLQYVAGTVMGFVSFFVIIFIFLNLWNYIYAEPGALIAGYNREQMIWYVMITEMIWFSARSGAVTRQTASDIRSGNIVYQMNKPYHYTLYILARYTGEWSIRLPMYMLLASGMGILMVGRLPGVSLPGLMAAGSGILLGIMVNGVFKLCISLLSFWIEDSNPFQWLYDKLILVVGTIFPLEIFPRALQPLLRMTPIYTVCYGPAKLVVDFSPEKYLEILSAQLFYLAAGLCIMFFVYGKGVKKLYVNGG